MAQTYGCGFIRTSDYAVIEALLPEGTESWDGEDNGQDNGFKPKKDYDKNMWFITCDSRTHLPKYLVRAHVVPGIPETIELSVAELPFINEMNQYPVPNQLTVDKDGNIFFPGGQILDDDGYPVLVQAEVTNETPFTVKYSTIPVSVPECSFGSTHCVTLSIDHSYVSTYATSSGENPDVIFVYNIATPALFPILVYDEEGQFYYTGIEPYNMETDSSMLSANMGWSYVILDEGRVPVICAFYLINPATPLVFTPREDSELVLAVDSEGIVSTMERINNSPADNILNLYEPQGGGALLYDQTVGLTQPIFESTHHDVRRSHNDDIWLASAISPDVPGDIREALDKGTGAQADRHTRASYFQIATATDREGYYVPPV